MKRAPTTLLEHCLARAGLVKGGRVASVIAGWAIASENVGHELTLQEYREWWRMSERTAYREQAIFREAFPEFSTPQVLADAIIEAYYAKLAEGEQRKLSGGIAALVKQPVGRRLVA